MECTCYIKEETSPLPPIIGRNRTLSIVKCPLCKAAPDLYEACKALLKDSKYKHWRASCPHPLVDDIEQAIAKVEGK